RCKASGTLSMPPLEKTLEKTLEMTPWMDSAYLLAGFVVIGWGSLAVRSVLRHWPFCGSQ
ncbi:MAG: hypothetical protein KDA99_09705, partial [Planctomycetales bacterium]|nr:hypothetical protein [Planctomycetales bacterium]